MEGERTTEYTNMTKSFREKYSFTCVFYFNVLIGCTVFGIWLPSIYPYVVKHGGDEWFFAATLFMYSLGELVGAVGFGYMHNYTTTMATFYTQTFMGLGAGIMYWMADYIGGNAALIMIIISRLICGFWTGGQQAMVQAYISEVVDKKDNLKVQSELGVTCVSGFILGPILGLLLSYVDVSIGPIQIDTYTCPGYIITIGTIFMITTTSFKFDEIPHDQRPYRNPPQGEQIAKPDTWGLILIYVFCLFGFNSLAVQETITTPLITDVDQKFTISFDWNVTAAYAVYAGSGVLQILLFVMMYFTSGKIDDRLYNIVGLCVGIVGWLLLVDWESKVIQHACFYLGYGLSAMSFNIVRVINQTMLTKLIGPTQAGGYFGWFLCIGAIARCAGPFWAVEALTISARVWFGSTAAFLAGCLILQVVFWKRTQPHPKFLESEQEECELKKE